MLHDEIAAELGAKPRALVQSRPQFEMWRLVQILAVRMICWPLHQGRLQSFKWNLCLGNMELNFLKFTLLLICKIEVNFMSYVVNAVYM